MKCFLCTFYNFIILYLYIWYKIKPLAALVCLSAIFLVTIEWILLQFATVNSVLQEYLSIFTVNDFPTQLENPKNYPL